MTYSTPELVVVGTAHEVVLGGPIGQGDNFVSLTSQPDCGVILGLDD